LRRSLTVTTPENVELSFELAGVGSRFIAALLDALLETAGVFAILSLVMGLGLLLGVLHVESFATSALLLALLVVALFAIVTGYYILFEARWNGQTPGKKAMGLRVMKDGGLPIDFPAAVIRNLLRAADFLPMLYGVGLVSILVSNDYKRLGDYVAGTVVVKERKQEALPTPQRQSPRTEYLLLDEPALRRISKLTRSQYDAARRYVERVHELDKVVARDLGQRIGAPIADSLEEQRPVDDWLHYLSEVVRAYEERILRRSSNPLDR